MLVWSGYARPLVALGGRVRVVLLGSVDPAFGGIGVNGVWVRVYWVGRGGGSLVGVRLMTFRLLLVVARLSKLIVRYFYLGRGGGSSSELFETTVLAFLLSLLKSIS